MNRTDDWYEVTRLAERSYLITEANQYRMYLIEGTERSVVIDTGLGIGRLRSLVTDLVDLPLEVVLTHTHWDHIGAAVQFDDVYVDPHELPLDRQVRIDSISEEFTNRPEEFVSHWRAANREFPEEFDVDTYMIDSFTAKATPPEREIDLGTRSLEVLPLPGHSPGHLGVLDQKTGVLYGGDILQFDRGLYILFKDSSLTDYIESIEAVVTLKSEGRFDVLATSHNDPLAGDELSIFEELLDALYDIVAGNREYELVDTPWGQVRSYRVGAAEVLTRQKLN
ncbi:MBL fold metallo-hydrolase [Natronorarus salvus]|uniref:MBL fold metallo-hydrolase n=1 Tax=Natronorarus salvus TaxID=3117733 RepID=UPI002F267406